MTFIFSAPSCIAPGPSRRGRRPAPKPSIRLVRSAPASGRSSMRVKKPPVSASSNCAQSRILQPVLGQIAGDGGHDPAARRAIDGQDVGGHAALPWLSGRRGPGPGRRSLWPEVVRPAPPRRQPRNDPKRAKDDSPPFRSGPAFPIKVAGMGGGREHGMKNAPEGASSVCQAIRPGQICFSGIDDLEPFERVGDLDLAGQTRAGRIGLKAKSSMSSSIASLAGSLSTQSGST